MASWRRKAVEFECQLARAVALLGETRDAAEIRRRLVEDAQALSTEMAISLDDALWVVAGRLAREREKQEHDG